MGKNKGRQWNESDVDAIEAALADLGGGNYFKAQDGKNVVRILPPYDDSGKWFIETKLHYGFKRDGKTVAIPADPGGYIEEKLNELASEGEEGAKLARRYGVRTKYYVNVIDRASGAVKIWGFSNKIMTSLKKYYFDEEDGARFDDPEEGRDIIIERTGKGLDTRYEIRFRPKPTPAIEEGTEIPELFNLEEETTKEFTKQDLKAIWSETMEGVESTSKKSKDDDDDDDDDEDEPKKKKKASDDDDDEESGDKKKKKKPVDDDDDDDDKDAEPVKKKKRR